VQAAGNESLEPSRVDSWERRKPPLLDSLVEEVLCFSFKWGFPLQSSYVVHMVVGLVWDILIVVCLGGMPRGRRARRPFAVLRL